MSFWSRHSLFAKNTWIFYLFFLKYNSPALTYQSKSDHLPQIHGSVVAFVNENMNRS